MKEFYHSDLIQPCLLSIERPRSVLSQHPKIRPRNFECDLGAFIN